MQRMIVLRIFFSSALHVGLGLGLSNNAVNLWMSHLKIIQRNSILGSSKAVNGSAIIIFPLSDKRII